MATFIIILILVLLFFRGIILKILSSTKEKKQNNDNDAHNHEHNTHNPHGNNNHGHNEHGHDNHTTDNKKKGFWYWTWNIVAVLGIGFICFVIFVGIQNCTREKEKDYSSPVTINPNEDPSKITYPIYGKQVISEGNPARAGLKPGISSFQILDNGEGKAILYLESDPSQFIICDQKADGTSKEAQEMINKWKTQLPWGNYLIEPYPKGSPPLPVSWKEGP